ncbi:MAG: aspartate-semialdehyde dehydrogenase, partial [Candidatus Binatia bacterium]|nr:aspartate-semialdehyde dehydrogenase [Candidatus Binatia bacterium]
QFPIEELRPLATPRSAGKTISWKGEKLIIREVSPEAFKGIQIAFFAATTGASRELAPIAARQGAVVVDKSNAWRMESTVPLVVPEVNPEALRQHRGIIASPNCSTVQMVVALKPLHDAAGLTRVVVSTYQAVSGTGRDAVEELRVQSRAILDRRPVEKRVYPHPIAFNLIPQIESFDEQGYSVEEMKMVLETRKIFTLPDLPVAATTVRVPVYIGHSESVLVETEEKLTADQARDILSKAPSIILMDDSRKGIYPVPSDCVGRDEVFVGRIREDLSSPRGLHLWVVSDNLRKGAATNAAQIAEELIKLGL